MQEDGSGKGPIKVVLADDRTLLRQGLASRERMNDFFRLPWRGRFDGSMKLWFLRRRSVRCRLRRL